uniref:Uncharacterized protein n=1 Tax=Avena sativa TaxID=4498 RepID=A0ACD5UEM8_AVESA
MSIHYVLIFFLLFLTPFCNSDDQLTHTKPLTHSDTLISKSGNFALGFFSPTTSNNSFYLGIWYHGIPGPRTVVWIANRDSPIITPSSGMLIVTNNSHMVLSNSKGQNIWTSTGNITAGAAIAHAVLLDSGNFVLRLPNGMDIWQSFDHPTDTILPSMKFLMSYKSQVVGRLVSWKGHDDPSSGDFSCSSDPSSPNLQFFTWNKTRPYCRIGVESGLSVSGGTYVTNTSSILYQTTIYSGDEFYYMFTISGDPAFTRIKLEYTGKLKFLSWNNHSSSWAIISERPSAACDLYASCGQFSYCDFTQIIPACQCLSGFEPVDGINFSKGCRRKQALKCGKQSHFVALPGMYVPDKFLHIRNKSFDECIAECSHNCSCTAYAYANLSSVGALADPSRCLVWSEELIDVKKGTLEGGNVVAVKRLSKGSTQGIVEFKNEVVLIAKLQHKNLVRLLGCCIHEDEKLLIYEYLPNKSLDAFLFDATRKHVLDWLTRFNIIKGISRGLLYLHQDSRLTIIHRDLKASNILLDTRMTPKISDFGMARIFGADQNQANTTRVVGTYGYMSPEYAMRGAFSVKSDTYSFGVLLLEIVSGLKISSAHLITKFSGLIGYAWRLWEDGKAIQLVDSSVMASCPLNEVLRCIHVGLLCVQDHASDRPLMSSVMFMLENETALLPVPKQPVYFALSNCGNGEGSESMENSINTVSITTLDGR